MNGAVLPHRTKNPRWCDQCKHPSIGRYSPARFIWRRLGERDIYLCTMHAEQIQRE